jgi:hypothetical protein
MNVSTIRNPKNNLSTIIMYIVGIVGVALVVFFGGEVVKNLDNLKGKSAVTIDVINGTAEVYINDENAGSTPYESEEIKPGYNKITLNSEGRQYETSINFLPNSNKYIHSVGLFRDLGVSDVFSSGQEFWFEKDKSGSVLRVVSEPSGASVYIDNTEVGKTPYSASNLSDGSYDLRVEAAGYEMQTARINIKKDYALNVSLKLFPLPAPSQISAFEGSPNLYDLSLDDPLVTSDIEGWAKAVLYWNKTRGINLEGLGVNKEPVFEYFIDYKGNVFDGEAKLITTAENFAELADAERGAYLGRASDGEGLTADAKEAFEALTGAGLGGKNATILETGLGWLRVRDAASLNSSEIARVNVGETFAVLEETSGWVKIKITEGTEGWVSDQYVEIVEE